MRSFTHGARAATAVMASASDGRGDRVFLADGDEERPVPGREDLEPLVTDGEAGEVGHRRLRRRREDHPASEVLDRCSLRAAGEELRKHRGEGRPDPALTDRLDRSLAPRARDVVVRRGLRVEERETAEATAKTYPVAPQELKADVAAHREPREEKGRAGREGGFEVVHDVVGE